MKCSHQQCKDDAKWQVVLVIATSDKTEVGKAQMGIVVCDEHKRGISAVKDVVPQHLWQQVVDGFASRGAESPVPDMGQSSVEFVDLDIIQAAAPSELVQAVQKIMSAVDAFSAGNTRPYLVQTAKSLSSIATKASKAFQNYPGESGKAERQELSTMLLRLASAADTVAVELALQAPKSQDDVEAAKPGEHAITEMRSILRSVSELFVPSLKASRGAN